MRARSVGPASVRTFSHGASRLAGETPTEWFVAEIIRELGLGTSATDVRTARLLIRLAEFATAEGLPLDREVIFDPDTIERFVTIGLASRRSRATYRSVLRSIGPRLTKRAPWEPKPSSIPRRQIAPPYSHSEIRLLFADAALQPTPARMRAAHALLVLGLGAGLDGRWVAKVRPSDVVRRGIAVVVTVGAPTPRGVVVRSQHEEAVLELVATARDEFLVGGHSRSANRAGNLVASFVVPTGHPPISPSRLRSTWLLDHLTTGTRMPELCRAAGVRSMAMFTELLELIPELPDAEVVAIMRGAHR